MFLGAWQMLAYEDGRWEVRHRNEVRASGVSGGRIAVVIGLVTELARFPWTRTKDEPDGVE